jgi:hypothetical protein
MGIPSRNRKITINPKMSTEKNAKQAKRFLIMISLKCLVTVHLMDLILNTLTSPGDRRSPGDVFENMFSGE